MRSNSRAPSETNGRSLSPPSDRFALHWDKAATPDELTARCLADVKLPARTDSDCSRDGNRPDTRGGRDAVPERDRDRRPDSGRPGSPDRA